MGRGARPVKGKVEAGSAVTRKSRSATGLQFKQRLAEALEQHAAVSEILQVISASPSDVQPVLNAVAERAARLCQAPLARVLLVDGDVLRAMAEYSLDGTSQARTAPLPLRRSTITGRAVLDRTTIHHSDVVPLLETEYPDALNARALGLRAVLAVPLMREGDAYGAVLLFRREPRPFSPAQVELVQTFARQAAIAIDNARLFKETKEALEQQHAAGEVLAAINSSIADTKPVFDKILTSCERLFLGNMVGINLVGDDGLVRLGAYRGPGRDELEKILEAGTGTGSAIRDRRIMHFPDVEHDEGASEKTRRACRAIGACAVIFAPMLWEGKGIGVIFVGREYAGPFSEKEIALLKTFADQAVIAIENVRSFDEVRARTRELSESLQQQTATADVLKVISRSAFDLQTVLDTLIESACKLCDATVGSVWRPDVDGFKAAAMYGEGPAHWEAVKRLVIKPGRDTCAGRALLEGRTVHIHDAMADPEYDVPDVLEMTGNRAMLGVPLLREGAPIGVLVLTRSVARPFTEKQIALATTFADQAVIAIENVRLFNETKEALEQQRASAEVLAAISSSIADTVPVFERILESCEHLFAGKLVGIGVVGEDRLLRLAAYHGPGRDEIDKTFPAPIDDQTAAGVVVIRSEVLHLPDADVGTQVPPATRRHCQAMGIKAAVVAPMLWEGKCLGSIFVGRDYAGPFSDKEIALLKTFADQAAIAIENVRLFNETKEALEQQTATSEILGVISQSPTDVQPVFNTITQAAQRLCDATSANLFTFDGELIHLVAHARPTSDPSDAVDLIGLRTNFPRPPGRDLAAPRAVLTCSVVSIPDVLADAEYKFKDVAVAGGFRSVLAVPLIRDGAPIGAIVVGRPEPGQFPDKQLALLQTFADQAVIAIENVRLFTALEARNRDLTETLEQQTATSDILRVISQSQTDVQPVFDTIVAATMKLCRSGSANVFTFDGELIHLAAVVNLNPEYPAAIAKVFPRPPGRDTAVGRAVLSRNVVIIPDVLEDREYAIRAETLSGGYRSLLAVPLIREENPIGAIVVEGREPGPFPDNQVALLKTFADQAVIAIENVRLFKVLEARTDALTRSVGQLTALGEVGQAVSSTLELETVLKTIVSRAVQLTGLDAGSIYEYDERAEEFRLQAAENMPQDVTENIRTAPTRKGDGALGRTAITLEPTQVPDILDDSYQSARKELLIRAGYRALLAVPLLREDHLLGGLVVHRKTPGTFAPEIVELLKTFATQSALAIQNARLFREIAEKGRQLEAASRHKSDFLASMSHELRTPLNAILGFNEMILGEIYGEVPASMKVPLEDIQTSGKHLLRLINNVLDLAKIEAGRMELALADYSVHDTVESVRATLRPLAVDKGLEFVATVPDDIPLAYGDSGRITQCLMNLAGNSLKFTKAGKVEISVETRGDLLVYKVADTGIGISPDKLETVFAEFKQTEATIANEYGGTGLGLSISRKFVEMHGGRIWVESELGMGSTFICEIPLRVNAGAPA